MKNILLFFLLLCFACNQPNPNLQTELGSLKEKLSIAENNLKNAAVDETTFVHTVFFWMNDDVSIDQKTNFAKQGLNGLSKISSIYKSYIGPPAKTSRGVIDNSYDFALVCHFKNAADQDAYQVDPIHLKFIEDYKHLWEKVIVYDNLVMD